MIELELLDSDNENKIKEIRRDDIPVCFAENISSTIELSKYGEENNLRGHCYTIKYADKYIGIILIPASNEPSGCLQTFGDCREGQQPRCLQRGC